MRKCQACHHDFSMSRKRFQKKLAQLSWFEPRKIKKIGRCLLLVCSVGATIFGFIRNFGILNCPDDVLGLYSQCFGLRNKVKIVQSDQYRAGGDVYDNLVKF